MVTLAHQARSQSVSVHESSGQGLYKRAKRLIPGLTEQRFLVVAIFDIDQHPRHQAQGVNHFNVKFTGSLIAGASVDKIENDSR